MLEYLLCAPVDESGSLDVWGEEIVHGVLLGKATVHRHHGRLQHDVGVAEVRDYLVDADNGRVFENTVERKNKCVLSDHTRGGGLACLIFQSSSIDSLFIVFVHLSHTS